MEGLLPHSHARLAGLTHLCPTPGCTGIGCAVPVKLAVHDIADLSEVKVPHYNVVSTKTLLRFVVNVPVDTLLRSMMTMGEADIKWQQTTRKCTTRAEDNPSMYTRAMRFEDVCSRAFAAENIVMVDGR